MNGNSASGAILELLLKLRDRHCNEGRRTGRLFVAVDWVVPGILGMNMM